MLKSLSASWAKGFYAARAISIHSNGDRTGERMGAAMFCGGKLISTGFNIYGKSHPAQRERGFISSLHAEHACIIKRRHYEPSGNLILYVYRETDKGVASCSKPCSSCENIIRLAGIRRVRYISSEGQAVEMKIT